MAPTDMEELWTQADAAFREDPSYAISMARAFWGEEETSSFVEHNPRYAFSTNYHRGCRCTECVQTMSQVRNERRRLQRVKPSSHTMQGQPNRCV